MSDISEVLAADDSRGRILDIWEFSEGRMCMVVVMKMHAITGEGGVTDERVPAYYNGYTQTTLTYGELCGERDYPSRVDAHGGITYGPDDAGWVGFDTHHAWDTCVDESGELLPGTNEPDRTGMVGGGVWSPERVKEEVESLAKQLDAVERELHE